jgi:serine/threonine protein phosphatase PrpC
MIQLDTNTVMISDIGPRSEMQDYGIFNIGNLENHIKWFIVCDGIGGQPHGAEAAKLACEVVDTYLKKSRFNKKILTSDSFSTELILNLQNEFHKIISANTDYQNMGCTLCMLIIYKKLGYVCWSGDSMLYQIRDQKCYWETSPHTWVFDLYKKGVLTLEQARMSVNNAITGCINGYTNNIRFNTRVINIKQNDIMVLCTDGIWSAYEYDELMQVLSNPHNEALLKLEEHLQKYATDNYYGFIVNAGIEKG